MNMRAIVFVVSAAVCAAALSGCGRKYTATSMLRINAQLVTNPPARGLSDEEFAAYKEKQRELLTSRLVLLLALRKPEVAKLPSVQTETKDGDPIRWLADVVAVNFPGNAEIMSVSCTTNDPHEAVVLTNAVVDAYTTEIVDADRKRLQRRLDGLEQLAAEGDAQLRNLRAELNRLTAKLSPDKPKGASSKRDSTDVGSSQSEIKNQEHVLHEFRVECEKIREELRALPRITVIQPAEDPSLPNKPSL
jgi:uncharacterized protein involved in exopolysaccharide biosynthesis